MASNGPRPTFARRARHALEQTRDFFGARIWSSHQDEARPSRKLLYRASRVVYATYMGFREKQLNYRAAALTYFSVLSIVPFLAFAFSLLKGFGAYERLVDQTIEPWLRDTFGESPALLRGFQQVLSFVDRTDFARLGTVGLLFLAYTAISLLSTIENALNDVWNAKSARPLLRRVTDYTTLVVITPLLVLTAITFATAAQSSGIVQFLRQGLGLGVVIDFFLGLTSLVAGCAAMIALYIIMPNVHTRLSSAVLGGTVAGLLWQAALVLHVRFQMGVASYNALYSGFGAVPIFLVWLYVSWLIVLLGAQLAASHQYEQTLRQAVRARHVDQETREALAVGITAEVARRFIDGGAPPTDEALTERLEVPQLVLEDVIEPLVRAGILARTVAGRGLGYHPARDVDALKLEDVREAVRRDPANAELKAALGERLGPRLVELLSALEEAQAGRARDLSLRDLAQLAAPPAPSPRVESVGAEVLDAKQPQVPA